MTNPHISTRSSRKIATIAAIFMAHLTLFGGVALAQITVLGTSSTYTSGALSGGTSHTLSYNPGATSTAIVVAVIMEASGAPSAVTFGGVAMTPVVGADGANVGIYFLNNPTTGAASNLTFNYTSVATVNFIAFQAVSLNASGPIEATATATDIDKDVTLTVPSSGGFVMAGFNFNAGAPATTCSANSPLTDLFSSFINSGGGALAYVNNVASGNQTYSFSLAGDGVPVARRVTAASFNVVPSDFSLMVMIAPAVAPDTGYDLQWTSRTGMTYSVLTSTDLATPVASWATLAADLPTSPPQNTYNVPADGDRRFYVIKETPAP